MELYYQIVSELGTHSRISSYNTQMSKHRNPLIAITALLTVISVSACSGLPALGTVGGQSIDTRVDNETARYYLVSYLSGRRTNPVLDQRIDKLYHSLPAPLPDRIELKHLSEEFSVDFAAAYFADRIASAPDNRGFREIFGESRRAYTQRRLIPPAAVAEYDVMFVPTYLYKRLPVLGSDLAAPRKALEKAGVPVYFVETVEDGAIETNAEIVAAAVAARISSGRRLILVSASKSGSEVALALTQLGPAKTRHVAGWINAVGALQGTPLADERALTDLERLVGAVDAAGIESLTTERSRRRFSGFQVPDHILIVNYFGIPLSGDLSTWSRQGFTSLSKYGPNDGILLLADLIYPGGISVAELGLDHFLLDRDSESATVGLVGAMIRWLAQSPVKFLPVSNR